MADFDPTVDIRDMIAHGRKYNPRANIHEPTPYKEFPKWVRTKNGSVIANSKAEEDAILGTVQTKPAPVSVDIANLAKPETAPVTKRKYTKRAAPLEMPKNLE